MIISKILNNNALICIDRDEEVVVRGKGISFKKNIGEKVDNMKIEKVYRLDKEIKNKFEEIVSKIDSKYIDISDEIITYALANGIKLNDIIYVNLADHLSLVIERVKENIFIANPLLMDIKRLYPDEYNVGLYALKIIKKRLGYRLNEDEAGFIVFNLINAQMDQNKPLAYEITCIVQNIIKIVRLRFNITFYEESVYYYRFITHLKFFAQRILSNNHLNENIDIDLYKTIKKQYQKSYDCIQYIKKYIEKNYNYLLSEDEEMYLMIHIQRIVVKSKEKEE